MAYTLTYKLINNDGPGYEVSGYTYTGDYSEVVIPNKYKDLPVKSIGNAAFQGCRARIIKIPDSVTNISTSAFYNCTKLNDIVIPSSVTNIGAYAFDNCVNLGSIEIPDSVTSIGSAVFDDCGCLTSITVSTGNANYKSIDGNLYTKDGKTLIQYAIGKTATSFTIPDSVTSIGSYAIKACICLTSIEIPDSVTSIGNGALSGCSHLKSITVSTGNANYKSIDGNLYTKDEKTLLCYAAGKIATSFTIPDSVTSIGSYAFYSCSMLMSVIIGDSVTSIEDRAFQGCNKLVSVVIPDSVTSIGAYAFLNCVNLRSIEIPDSVTSIGKYAFFNCDSLMSVVIPDGVTSIGNEAFYDCSKLMDITLLAKTPADISSDVFSYISANAKFYCYSSALQSYKTATNWNTYADKFVTDDMILYFTMSARAQKKYFASKKELHDLQLVLVTKECVETLEARIAALEAAIANVATTDEMFKD